MRMIVALGLAIAAALMPFAARADAPFSRGLLFRVDRAGAYTSWVFGTIHSAEPRTLALPQSVTRAFAQARSFAPEIVLSDVDADEFFGMAQFDDGRALGDYFDHEALAAIRCALGTSAPAEPTFARLKPWAVLLKLAQAPAAAATERATLDASLLAAARVRRMPLIGLELPAEQASAFDSIPLDTQIALVRYLLRERDALAREHAATIDAWLDRDLAKLAALAEAPPRAMSRSLRGGASAKAACSLPSGRCICTASAACSRCCASRAIASGASTERSLAPSAPAYNARREHRRPSHRIQAREARRGGRRPRSVPPVRPLVRRGARREASGAQRDDSGDRRRRRTPGRAHHAAQGIRRARLRFLHELREPQGSRARTPSALRAAVSLDRARAPGAHRGHGGARGRYRIGRIFRRAAARVAAWRMGVAAKRADREPRRPRGALRGGRSAVRRRR